MNESLTLALVCCGAVLHAAWNCLVKSSGSGDVLFVWCCSMLMAPVAGVLLLFWAVEGRPFDDSWWSGLVSMMMHTIYAVILQRAYAVADMSLIYPIARGLAPIVVSLVALTWAPLPGAGGWFGMGLVLVGVVCMAELGAARERGMIRGTGYGLLVAAGTSAYTLWDAYSAQVLHVDVLPYLAVSGMAQATLLTAVCWGRRRQMRSVLVENWKLAAPIAVLSPLSYAFVLLAMQVGAPSMVATARSMNIVVGTLAAALLLRERVSRPAMIGVGMIFVGAVVGTM